MKEKEHELGDNGDGHGTRLSRQKYNGRIFFCQSLDE
jgi:hypothetical protein